MRGARQETDRRRRRGRRYSTVAALVVVMLALSGCASAHAHGVRRPGSAHALVMTKAVAAALVQAAARINGHIPVAQYAGFDSKGRHYAYDPKTHTSWAAGRLLPRTDSSAAAVSLQDDGSYNVFRKRQGGAWKAFDVGLAGVGGTKCAVVLPSSVLRLWGWPAGACRPAQQG